MNAKLIRTIYYICYYFYLEVLKVKIITNMVWKKLLCTVPKTDTGELVIYTEVVEKTILKELCKLIP